MKREINPLRAALLNETERQAMKSYATEVTIIKKGTPSKNTIRYRFLMRENGQGGTLKDIKSKVEKEGMKSLLEDELGEIDRLIIHSKKQYMKSRDLRC